MEKLKLKNRKNGGFYFSIILCIRDMIPGREFSRGCDPGPIIPMPNRNPIILY